MTLLHNAILASSHRLYAGLGGFEGVRHQNLRHDHGPGHLVGSHHDLWLVKKSFRLSTTDLRAWPVFARTRGAIDAHPTINQRFSYHQLGYLPSEFASLCHHYRTRDFPAIRSGRAYGTPQWKFGNLLNWSKTQTKN